MASKCTLGTQTKKHLNIGDFGTSLFDSRFSPVLRSIVLYAK
jgi:hypothetical protein